MKMMQSLSRYMQLPVCENRLVVKWTLADPLFLCGSILWSASTLPHATTFNNINITLWIALLINYHRPCFSEKLYILGLFWSLTVAVFPMRMMRFKHRIPWFFDLASYVSPRNQRFMSLSLVILLNFSPLSFVEHLSNKQSCAQYSTQ